ncbi:hypothetical protein CASFOL_020828 [Castilleja foliolosa]|uniref:P-type ATPase C-terminal domain-containing protein n=1 Tax=Castilleja foliolosa TaxID=1961234 RepID=A0ABD3D5L2_9LAMI
MFCEIHDTSNNALLMGKHVHHRSLNFGLPSKFQTGFSGQIFYDDWFQSLYNVIFTVLPVIIIGLFDNVYSRQFAPPYDVQHNYQMALHQCWTVGGSLFAWFVFVFIYSGSVLPKEQYYSDKLKGQFRYRWMATFVLACFYLHVYYHVTFYLGVLLSLFLRTSRDLLPVSSNAPIKTFDKFRPFVPLKIEIRFCFLHEPRSDQWDASYCL